MSKDKNNKDVQKISNSELERQKIIDEGGTQEYGNGSQRKTKDENILIDSEH